MANYTKTKTIRITETQHQTLLKMKSYKVDIGNFIREAIREKIQREYSDIIVKPKNKTMSKDCLRLIEQLELNK